MVRFGNKNSRLVHRLLPRASGSKVNSCPLSSHEIDGVRKEKERLTASKLNVQLLSPSKFQSFTGKLDTSLSFLGTFFAVKDSGTIGEKLPLDAINPAHRSLLRLNSPSHGIFSLFLNFQLMAQQLVL